MMTTPASGVVERPANTGRPPVVPPPVAVTVTMAFTSRPPSGRYGFWYTSAEKCGTRDLAKLAISSAP